ncbi:MAG: histidinol dehydrogenase [Nitrospirae bacterium]|nr:histidinol dehydrogenase [Nitrospirota bacterium]
MRTLKYGRKDFETFFKKIEGRAGEVPAEIEKRVKDIIAAVAKDGDKAVIAYTEKFDGLKLTPKTMKVSEKEIARAYAKASEEDIDALRIAARRIADFHERQKQNSWFVQEDSGALLGQRVLPLETVGIYVPGGKAAYPSSVLMNAVPAKVAGVPKVVMVVPAPGGKLNPLVLVAADLAGVDEIYRIGGAQAVAALAHGTKTVPKVDKIVGPGNIYVATAKRLVFGLVDIDMVAGPSEILVVADRTARPEFIAADMLSQAEHDEMASAVLVTDSADTAKAVESELEKQLGIIKRSEIARKSLADFGAIIIVENLKQAAEIANRIAPEHLELAVHRPFELLPLIKNAGAIFMGHYTPEAVGDYAAGPNHVLPTGGTARFFSPLSTDDFVKKSSILSYTKEALEEIAPVVLRLAKMEGLDAHGRMVEVRLK